MLEKIIQQYDDYTFIVADGFDDAVIGVDVTTMKLIYSVEKCINILMENMSFVDAMEYFTFNVGGANIGEGTPIWCWDIH
jgi:hypothetical protein